MVVDAANTARSVELADLANNEVQANSSLRIRVIGLRTAGNVCI
jgi:hypothetical protein